MEYFTISTESLASDTMMLLVTILAVGIFSIIVQSNSIITGESRNILLPDIMEIVGALIFYALVSANVFGFTGFGPSLFVTLSMFVGGIYMVMVPVVLMYYLIKRVKNKNKS